VLGFAHTVGEFGVVLMIGGNIPGETRVLSVAIYGHVEALEFATPTAWPPAWWPSPCWCWSRCTSSTGRRRARGTGGAAP
jgi:hypothetical protein